MRLDHNRLINVKRQSDGSIQCQCPVCAQDGKDRAAKNHLRIYNTGAFSCIVDNSKPHTRAIAAFLRGTAPDDNPDIIYIDPEPAIKTEKVYDEETLTKLLPDYSYWVGRGAKESVLKALEGGLAPHDEKSKLSNRFIFPIRGRDGRINGFTGRLIEENSYAPTWKHLFKSSLAAWPWNVTGPHIIETKTVVLVESVGDLLALMSHGIMNVLCIFGLNLNSRIISTLIAHDVKKVIVSLNRDDDPTKGQKAADHIASRLRAFYSDEHIEIRLPPIGVKDWGECPAPEIAAFKTELTQPKDIHTDGTDIRPDDRDLTPDNPSD